MSKKRNPKPSRIFRDGRPAATCLNCGQPGPHFIPPSFGDPGFFHCTKKATA